MCGYIAGSTVYWRNDASTRGASAVYAIPRSEGPAPQEGGSALCVGRRHFLRSEFRGVLRAAILRALVRLLDGHSGYARLDVQLPDAQRMDVRRLESQARAAPRNRALLPQALEHVPRRPVPALLLRGSLAVASASRQGRHWRDAGGAKLPFVPVRHLPQVRISGLFSFR